MNSLKVWWNSPVKPSGSGLLFIQSFLITALISLLIGLFKFSVLPGLVLEGCVFLEIYQSLLDCLMC